MTATDDPGGVVPVDLAGAPTGPPRSPLTWRQAAALLGVVLGLVVVGFGAVVLGLLLVPGARDHGATLLGWSVPLMSVAVLAALHVGLRRCGTDWRGLGFVPATWRMLHLLWQVPAALVVVLAVQVAAAAVLGLEPSGEGDAVSELLGAVPAGPAVALAVGVGVLTPLWEEAVFRGVVHGGLRRRLGVRTSSALSGGVFAAAHGVPALLPYMLAAGVCLALLHEFHRTLWAPVAAHVLLNSAVTVPVLLAVLTA